MARWRESCDPCPNHLPIRRFCDMWWRHTPRTDQERLQEIARLTKKRDHLLDRAPEAVLVRRTIILCFLGLMIFLVGEQIFFQPARYGFIGIFALAVFGALLFVILRGSSTLPSIGDRWGMSRLLSYEGDSPQELQNKIERLRAQMDQADQPKQD